MPDNYRQGNSIMSTASPQYSTISECERLLRTSNQLYRSMLQNLTMLGRFPEAATAQQLQGRLQQFNELQQNIELHDSQLSAVVNGLPPSLDRSTEMLLEERRELLEQVLQQNKKVTLQAQAIHSLLADEIRKSSTGYAALKGYHQPEQHQRSSGSFRRSM